MALTNPSLPRIVDYRGCRIKTLIICGHYHRMRSRHWRKFRRASQLYWSRVPFEERLEEVKRTFIEEEGGQLLARFKRS